ncbi:MAG: hypothetical protein H6Q30_2717 [Bacteroidetes bacterium]|nr:hypothetical protein [Bacteroidota bacterium]
MNGSQNLKRTVGNAAVNLHDAENSLVIASIRRNLRRLVKGWGERPTRALQRYVGRWSSANDHPIRPSPTTRTEPIWLLLPHWLADLYVLHGKRRIIDRNFLSHILWAQFSLFLAIKIQDDLFDKQLVDGSTIWMADEFLLEAQRQLGMHFAGSKSFWDFYAKSISTTVRAIDLVDRYQSRRWPDYRVMTRFYPSMYAICRIATRAVCMRSGNSDHFRRACRFLDLMALTGQVLDDLEDIWEDLQRGRMNAAAAFLAPRLRYSGRGSLKDRTAMFQRDGVEGLFKLLHIHVQQAQRTIRFLENSELTEYLKSYSDSLGALKTHLLA